MSNRNQRGGMPSRPHSGKPSQRSLVVTHQTTLSLMMENLVKLGLVEATPTGDGSVTYNAEASVVVATIGAATQLTLAGDPEETLAYWSERERQAIAFQQAQFDAAMRQAEEVSAAGVVADSEQPGVPAEDPIVWDEEHKMPSDKALAELAAAKSESPAQARRRKMTVVTNDEVSGGPDDV